MVDNSTTGDYANPVLRAYLEAYNATRGSLYRFMASGNPGQMVAPMAPVRFVDGEATEDWIVSRGPGSPRLPRRPRSGSARLHRLRPQHLGRARGRAVFPEGEYHVFRIDRTDPDRGDFDGIDWARVWGGRYRFMIVDARRRAERLRVRDVGQPGPVGQRLGAVRPAAVGVPGRGAPPGHADRRRRTAARASTSAITPGEFWDDGGVRSYVLARTVNEADQLPLLPLVPVRAATGHRSVLPVRQRVARLRRRVYSDATSSCSTTSRPPSTGCGR